MARKIQHKRGLEKNLPTLAPGEFALTEDTKKVFIGTDSGNVEVTNKEAVDNLTAQLLDTAKKSEVQSLTTNKADKTYVDQVAQSIASGSPKGTYSTLDELQSAFPTGNTNIYLVTADGKWYYWNGTAWTPGGQYQSTGIAENSIDANKTNFLEIDTTNNLFTGIYQQYNISGAARALTMSSSSTGRTFICKIEPNTTYSIIKVGSSERFGIATDSELKTSGKFNGAVNGSWGSYTNRTIETGPSDKYLYVNVSNTSNEPFMQIVKGTQTTATVSDFIYKPKNTLNVFDKSEVKSILKDVKKIRVIRINDYFLVLYPSKKGNYVGYKYGLYTVTEINVNVWRLVDVRVYDSALNTLYFITNSGADIEGVLKISGESDYIGSVHGDETFTSIHIYLDGFEVSVTDTIDGYYDTVEFVVSSNVYRADTQTVAFEKLKSTLFDINGVHVKNRWTPTSNITLVHVRGCLLSVNKMHNSTTLINNYRDSTRNILPQDLPAPSSNTITLVDTNTIMTDFSMSGPLVVAKLWPGVRGGTNNSAQVIDFGDRVKPYFDSYVGETVNTGTVIHSDSNFMIQTI